MFHLDHGFLFSFLNVLLRASTKLFIFLCYSQEEKKHTKLLCFLDNSE